jgi:lysophospholipase L1-like esterase
VAVSDSLTNDEPDNWLALVAAKHAGITAVAEAHGGWTTRSYFKEKFAGVAFARIPRDADVFLILLGSNNLFEAGGGSEAAIGEAVEGVQKIAAKVLAESPGAEIVLIAPPTIDLAKDPVRVTRPDERGFTEETPVWLRKLGVAYRELALRRGWRFIDLYPVLGPEDFVDAAHPNAAGNRKMAEAVWSGLCNRKDHL